MQSCAHRLPEYRPARELSVLAKWLYLTLRRLPKPEA